MLEGQSKALSPREII